MPQNYSMSCMNAPHCGFYPLSWELLARAFEGQLVPLYAVLYNAQFGELAPSYSASIQQIQLKDSGWYWVKSVGVAFELLKHLYY